jgi:quinol monooxygenase YgiN
MMIVVAGALTVDAARREGYLEGCVDVVIAARSAPGCLDFALSADLLDPARINVFERWASEEDLQRFRGGGPGEGQRAALVRVDVGEYAVVPAQT